MRFSIGGLAVLICLGLLVEPAMAKSDAYKAGKLFGFVLIVALIIGAFVFLARRLRSKA